MTFREMELANGQWFGGDTWAGTLEFTNSACEQFEISCHHSVVLLDFGNPNPLEINPKIIVQAIQINAEDFQKRLDNKSVRRGLRCVLKLATGLKIELMIWSTAIFNAGVMYQFLLVDKDFQS